jgi:hypothetical protein
MEMKEIICSSCESTNVFKHGTSYNGKSRYICKHCGSTFTPNRGSRGPSVEASHCRALFQWAQMYNEITRDYLIRNETFGFRLKKTAVNLRREGGKKGIADYFLAFPSNGFHGLWLEMKAPKPYKSNVSEEQKYWLEKQRSIGYAAHVAYGWEEAARIISEYLA